MNDKPIIVAGLALFVVVATFPIWYTRGLSGNAPPPDLELPNETVEFSAPWSAVRGDWEGGDWKSLRGEFEKYQISLSDKAEWEKAEQGDEWSKWWIIDEATRYLLVRNEETLEVSDSAGAILFSIEWSRVGGDSDEEIDWERLQEEFKEKRIAFSNQARLVEEQESGKWRIDTPRRYLVWKTGETVEIYDGCVEAKDFMSSNHMNLLIDWREGVVRRADKSQIEINGEMYPKSLTGSCLKCHANRETFCYRCHEYANALPAWPSRGPTTTTARPGIRCWNCHVDSQEEKNDG